MEGAYATRAIEQFYAWEQLGRGWQLYPKPVLIEPPYTPFRSHHVQMPYRDDGKRPTLLSSIIEHFRPPTTPAIVEDEPFAIDPFVYKLRDTLTVINVSFPKDRQLDIAQMEQLLVMLGHCRSHISFEIIANHTAIAIQVAYHANDGRYLQSQLRAFFPDCTIHEEDRLVLKDTAVAVVDFGLKEEFMRPLRTGDFDHEPLVGLYALLEQLQEDEQVVMQVLFTGTVKPWSESIITSVTDGDGDSFFLDAPEMPELALEKVARPLHGVCIRVMTQATSLNRASSLLHNISYALSTASRSEYNSLIALHDTAYDTHIADILHRRSHRLGMLLNARELATLAHFPSIAGAKLLRIHRTTKAAPNYTGAYILGNNTHQGHRRMVSLNDEMRLKHIHIIGATGMGKSTLLQSLIHQDILQGNGLCLIDPHGDLIESILTLIPAQRINDVVLIDPFDRDYPVGFNILKAHSDIEKELLATDLVALFRRFATSWGDQMNSVLANAIMAFLESTTGGTLIDLRRFLIEKSYREQFLTTVSDPQIVYYWQKEYPLLKSTSLGSILTRLDGFLRPKLIRDMVSQEKSLDFEHIMDTKKILLVKLSEGLIGQENSFLLGAFIVSKLEQTAMARQAKALADRTPFYCYIDEFHHFITPSMSAILSGGRKYGLGLILSHQSFAQVSMYDSVLANALLNAGTRICFRLGDDAKRFQDGFAAFTANDLENLSVGEAIGRIGGRMDDFSLSVIAVPNEAAHNLQASIIERSRNRYGTPIENTPTEIASKPIVSIPVHNTGSVQPPSIIKHDVAAIEQKQEIRQHRYLQTLIKKLGQERGYRAEIELPTPDGTGRVDVALVKEQTRIAVEISVTTTIDWEMHNIRKCFVAGYDVVVLCSSNQATLRAMRERVYEFTDTERSLIHVMEPQQLTSYLDSRNAPTPAAETRIKGYRVTLSYESLSREEQQQKSASVSRIVREALGRRR